MLALSLLLTAASALSPTPTPSTATGSVSQSPSPASPSLTATPGRFNCGGGSISVPTMDPLQESDIQIFTCSQPWGSSRSTLITGTAGQSVSAYHGSGADVCAAKDSANTPSLWNSSNSATASSSTLLLTNTPCDSTVCCTFIKCGTGTCSGLTLRVYYVPPAAGGGGNSSSACVLNAAPLPALVGSANAVDGGRPVSLVYRGCTVGSGTKDATIANPAGSLLNIFSTDGEDCGRSPSSTAFKFYTDFSAVNTRDASVVLAGAPCQTSPCCTVVQCRDTTCLGVSITQSFAGKSGPGLPPWAQAVIAVVVVAVVAGAVCGYCVQVRRNKAASAAAAAAAAPAGTTVVMMPVVLGGPATPPQMGYPPQFSTPLPPYGGGGGGYGGGAYPQQPPQQPINW